MPLPFQVKICGLTNPDDALQAVAAGADALGLNFFPGSKRFVSLADAAKIAAAVRQANASAAKVCLVGVFVNASVPEIVDTVAAVGLDAIQLHGDETSADVHDLYAALQARPSSPPLPLLLRAFRCQGTNLHNIADYLQACRTSAGESLLQGLLLDAFQPGTYGGTGEVIDWTLVDQQRHLFGPIPFVLAGGLVPTNVAQAIRTCHPAAVDVASGVEKSPRRKDPSMVSDFIAAARNAFADARTAD